MIFFFQAEDGIRDIGVTGVQTCALPIWVLRGAGRHHPRRRQRAGEGLPGYLPPLRRRLRHRHAGGRRPEDGGVRDRKSVVLGKSVDLGGCRIIKKKNKDECRICTLSTSS